MPYNETKKTFVIISRQPYWVWSQHPEERTLRALLTHRVARSWSQVNSTEHTRAEWVWGWSICWTPAGIIATFGSCVGWCDISFKAFAHRRSKQGDNHPEARYQLTFQKWEWREGFRGEGWIGTSWESSCPLWPFVQRHLHLTGEGGIRLQPNSFPKWRFTSRKRPWTLVSTLIFQESYPLTLSFLSAILGTARTIFWSLLWFQ